MLKFFEYIGLGTIVVDVISISVIVANIYYGIAEYNPVNFIIGIVLSIVVMVNIFMQISDYRNDVKYEDYE